MLINVIKKSRKTSFLIERNSYYFLTWPEHWHDQLAWQEEGAKTEDPFQPDAEVEFIDGNHTQHVMLQLQELCPEIEEHKTMFSSTRSCHQELCHFLIGLLRNNKTSNSFIWELVSLKNYQLWEMLCWRNMKCPNDRKEETNSKKRLHHNTTITN